MTVESLDKLMKEAPEWKPKEPLANTPDRWPKMEEEAHYGLAGEIIAAIEPHSEADPVAILVNVLIGFGNVVGSGPFVMVESTRHFARENAILVGETSKGRKGMSWSTPKRLLGYAQKEWVDSCIKTGLASGEGLIFEVRDAIRKQEPIRENKRVVGYDEVIVDPGVIDKRRLIIEPEFASTLTVMSREGNILSAVIRQAWDEGTLSPLTKNSPITATEAHISIIGHITKDELLRQLSETERANGFANRFPFFLIRRSKCLPEGGTPPEEEMIRLAGLLREVFSRARSIGEMRRDPEAKELWAEVYPALSEGKPGLTGAVLARAEAHVLRFSMIYALLDGSELIRVPHLKAALALWDYAEASARLIFGDATGDWVADRILAASNDGPLSETDINNLFRRNVRADRIQRALSSLVRLGRIEGEPVETGGRPAKWWRRTR